MIKFIITLLSKEESEVDSVIFGALLSLVTMLGVTVYVVVMDHTSWNPLTFATGAGAIVASLGGSKTLRDKFSTLVGQGQNQGGNDNSGNR